MLKLWAVEVATLLSEIFARRKFRGFATVLPNREI